jgi:hypothetical protein
MPWGGRSDHLHQSPQLRAFSAPKRPTVEVGATTRFLLASLRIPLLGVGTVPRAAPAGNRTRFLALPASTQLLVISALLSTSIRKITNFRGELLLSRAAWANHERGGETDPLAIRPNPRHSPRNSPLSALNRIRTRRLATELGPIRVDSPRSGGGYSFPSTRSTTQQPRRCVSDVSRQWLSTSSLSQPASWSASARIGIRSNT